MKQRLSAGILLVLPLFVVCCQAPDPQAAKDVSRPTESTQEKSAPAAQGTTPASAEGAPPAAAETKQERTLREERTFGDVTVRLLGPEEKYDTTVEIVRNGEVLYTRREENSVQFPQEGEPVQDFTRDGTPDLLLMSFTGGAHCCFTFTVLSLGPEVTEAARLETGNAELSLKDEDGDGIAEFHTWDEVLAYWGTCYAGSAGAPIVLVFENGRLGFAEALMRKPAPDDQDWRERLDEVATAWQNDDVKTFNATSQKDWGCAPVPAALWQNLIDLIYTGNGPQAWRFLDEAWPKHKPGKDNFRKVFEAQLAKSAFKQHIEQLNRS